MTTHSAEGRTADRAAMDVDETTTSEALHVGMTRGRVPNTTVAGADMEELADHMKAAAAWLDEHLPAGIAGWQTHKRIRQRRQPRAGPETGIDL